MLDKVSVYVNLTEKASNSTTNDANELTSNIQQKQDQGTSQGSGKTEKQIKNTIFASK